MTNTIYPYGQLVIVGDDSDTTGTVGPSDVPSLIPVLVEGPQGPPGAQGVPGQPGLLTYAAKNVNYTLADSDGFIDADASLGDVTITLPTAIGRAGREFTVKRVDNSGNTLTLAASGGQNIDGSSTYTLSSQNSTINVVSSGSSWRIRAKF
jgi:hypothetical protein